MLELALALPLLLLVLVGAIEVGWYYNTYLTLIDATREAARYSANGTPASFDTNTDCAKTEDFFKKAACLVLQNMHGVKFDPVRDDVVISLILIKNGQIYKRAVDSYASGQTMPDSVLNTSKGYNGWSRCRSLPATTNPTTSSPGCVPDESLLPNSVILDRLAQYPDAATAPNSAYILVEIYHVHHQFLGLIPPGLRFLPQEVMMHAYTIMPVPAVAVSIP